MRVILFDAETLSAVIEVCGQAHAIKPPYLPYCSVRLDKSVKQTKAIYEAESWEQLQHYLLFCQLSENIALLGTQYRIAASQVQLGTNNYGADIIIDRIFSYFLPNAGHASARRILGALRQGEGLNNHRIHEVIQHIARSEPGLARDSLQLLLCDSIDARSYGESLLNFVVRYFNDRGREADLESSMLFYIGSHLSEDQHSDVATTHLAKSIFKTLHNSRSRWSS